MTKRNYYLIIQEYGSTRYSVNGFDVEVHVFAKESERDTFYKEAKTRAPWLFISRISGREYLRDKYTHRATIAYCVEGAIRHGNARFNIQEPLSHV